MLNIRTRAVAETLTFDLLDADDSPLIGDNGQPVQCTVYGPGSKPYQQADQRRRDRMVSKVMKGKSPSAEDQAAAQAEFLADITVSLDLAYDDLEGRAKLLAMYRDTEVGFIAEQINKKVGDWGNFKRT